MNISEAIKLIFNTPKPERVSFITENFYVTKEYAIELKLTLEHFEQIIEKKDSE